ncbi:isoprenylcysteine carboxylmethyltransferase family protein [Variovorax sp. J22P240]|uniref:methyltransferase family protein n=1 Tax=unclassified Variovorax TaxID=663243 RepID=UPI002575FD47|nr:MULTISPECIES: isoprenylcysteine carboxylmethyltransferase family protein [unclassified Variovorax]MDL9998840.1 isoprenylcysteine carboxylmethyltransferase family protein [Variovorax sp. J22P240]MDM0050656.1 isoprenylcysteine carboxylmethyltransferase family protein [Variovorax sp. J22R115]
MNVLEHRIPPPLVALAAALLMWLVSLLPPDVEAPFAWRATFAIVVAAAGVAFSVAGMRAFHQSRTTMNPFTPDMASALVTRGVYRLTRNPMYLGLLLDLLAWAVFLWDLLALAVLPLFALYIQRFQIASEERALSLLFGAEYAAYQQRVRRWL